LFERKTELKGLIKQLESSIRKSSEMIMSTELVSMKRVMRRLDLADKNDVPTLKGKVAAHISASDEILVTEMLFSGLFNDI
jgi:ATP-dependent RNA helicase DOB1